MRVRVSAAELYRLARTLEFPECVKARNNPYRRRYNSLSACSRRDLSLKRRYGKIGGVKSSMKGQIPNINAVRSAWRRVKKNIKDAIIRDLRPVKDVKGGGGGSKSPQGSGGQQKGGGQSINLNRP